MTFKSSFLASLYENLKRRNWLIAVSSLFFFLYYPVATIMGIQRVDEQQGWYVRSQEGWLEEFFRSHLTVNTLTVWITVCASIICAIQGFSYLNSRKKVDFYHALPVSKLRRFSVIYINGVFAYAVPYIIGLCASLLIALIGTNSLNAGIAASAFTVFLLHLLLFLAVYEITIIAVVLTGHRVIAFFATFILIFYENMISMLITVLSQTFFHTYSDYGSGSRSLLTSPFTPFFRFYNNLEGTPDRKDILMLFLLVLVYGAIAYLLYRIRPAEGAGKALAFYRTKPFIKIMLMVPLSLVSALLAYMAANEETVFLLFGFVLGLFINHAVIQTIYEFDIHAVLQGGRGLLLSGVLTVAIYVVFRFDLIGYDTYIPAEGSVLSAAVSVGPDQWNYYSSDYKNIYYEDYRLERMQLEDVAPVLELASKSLDTLSADYDTQSATRVFIKYNMKNGREVYRQIYINTSENEESLNNIMTQEEYIKSTFQLFDPELNMSDCSYAFSNGVEERTLPKTSVEEFLAIYKQDMMCYSYDLASELPVGEVKASKIIRYQNYNSNYDWAFPVYASFENTLEFLKEKGLYLQLYPDPEGIASIVIEDYAYRKKVSQDYDVVDDMNDVVERIYTDSKNIKRIVPFLYPRSLLNSYTIVDSIEAEDYSIRVGLIDNPMEADWILDYVFLKDSIPEFPEEDHGPG